MKESSNQLMHHDPWRAEGAWPGKAADEPYLASDIQFATLSKPDLLAGWVGVK